MNESEERYRSLFNSIDEGFCTIELIFDEAGTPIDYRFLELNPAFEEHTGMVGALGRCMREIIPEHEQSWFDLYGKVAKTGEAIRFENYSSMLKRWFSLYAFRVDRPEQLHVAVIFTDITAKKAEKVRAEFLAKLSKDLAGANTEDDIIRLATDATGRHLEVDRCYFVEFSETDGRIHVSHNWVRGDLPSLQGEFSLLDFGGIEWWHQYTSGDFAVEDVAVHPLTRGKAENYAAIGIRAYAVQPFRQEGARVVALGVADCKPRAWTKTELSLIDDVVARVWPLVARARVEKALRASEERARHMAEEALSASRAKDDFLAALSHELRTPLTPVLMTVSALEEEPGLDPIVREDIAMIKRNVQLEARLIDDLLDLTRITHGKFQILRAPVDLHTLLTQTEDIARADGLGKSVHMEYRMRAERSRVLADGTRLLQVLWNLLKNALKFTPAGGKVTISTRNEDEDFVVVEVVDTGVGIRAEVLPHVFNAFEQGDQRGKHRYGGLGLGLAISKAIVDAHGGTLTATSEGVGRGATFTLRLAVEK